MNTVTDQVLRNIFEKLQTMFPFPGYCDRSMLEEITVIVRELRKYLPDFDHRRLLDIGSGPMDKTAMFKLLGFQCCAADDLTDPWHQRNDNADKIKEFAAVTGIEFCHQTATDYAIPFEPESFDVVCALGVIEHLHESPRGLLNTMGRFVRREGLLVIAMPNSVNLRKRLSVLLGRTNYPSIDAFYYSSGQWRGHVREYTLSEAAFICQAAGFEILTQRTFEHLACKKLRTPLREFYLMLTSIVPTLGSGLLVICRKPASWKPQGEDLEAFRAAISRAVPEAVA